MEDKIREKGTIYLLNEVNLHFPCFNALLVMVGGGLVGYLLRKVQVIYQTKLLDISPKGKIGTPSSAFSEALMKQRVVNNVKNRSPFVKRIYSCQQQQN